MAKFGYDYKQILPHGSYLVNLGNPDKCVSSQANAQVDTICVERSERSRTNAFLTTWFAVNKLASDCTTSSESSFSLISGCWFGAEVR
jgi:hypothetical protein